MTGQHMVEFWAVVGGLIALALYIGDRIAEKVEAAKAKASGR